MTDTPPREFTGRDLVEALQEAARSFGVRRSDLGYELIENYGVGARGCVIRAWPRAGARSAERGPDRGDFARADRPPRSDRGDRGDRGGRGDRGDRGGRSGRGGERPAGRGGGRGERHGGRGGGHRHDLPEGAVRQAPPERSRGGMYDDAMPARLSDRPAGHRDDRPRRGGGGGPRRRDDRRGGESDWNQRGGQGRRSGGGSGSGGSGGGGGRGPRQRDRGAEGGRPDRQHRDRDRDRAQDERAGRPRRQHRHHEPPKREPTVPATLEHAGEVRDLLEEIIDRWGMELHVDASAQDDTVTLSLTGPDAERLAADDGALLDSLQYLVSKMTSRLLTDNVRVLLDAAGFRDQRDQALRDRAIAMAQEALSASRKLRMDPLNPYERRVVHIALKEIPGVRTYSIGRGYLKRVTIEPQRDDETAADDSEE